MPSAGDFFGSRFLTAEDLKSKEHGVTMDGIEVESMQTHGGHSEQKLVVYFKGRDKGLVLNKTNGRTISEAYGDDTDKWLGKPLILYPTRVDFQGRQVLAVRVKLPLEATLPPGDDIPF